MKNKLLLSAGLFASSFLLSADKRHISAAEKLDRDPIAYLMSDEYKMQLFDDITHATIPADALAQIDTSPDTAGEMEVEKIVFADMNHMYEAKHQSAQNAGLVFTYNKKRYKVKADDLLQVDSLQREFVKKIDPDASVYTMMGQGEKYKIFGQYDGSNLINTIEVSSFVYLNKKALLGALAHEASHIDDVPFPEKRHLSRNDSLQLIRYNEFRADKRAAELTSPEQMITTLCQMSLSLQDDFRAMPVDSAKKYVSNTRTFGFSRNIPEIHPGAGRRIQYLQMLKLYKQNKIPKPALPPEQSFTPRFVP